MKLVRKQRQSWFPTDAFSVGQTWEPWQSSKLLPQFCPQGAVQRFRPLKTNPASLELALLAVTLGSLYSCLSFLYTYSRPLFSFESVKWILESLTWALFCFLICLWNTINFPLNIAFTVPHNFWWIFIFKFLPDFLTLKTNLHNKQNSASCICLLPTHFRFSLPDFLSTPSLLSFF